MGLFSNLFKQNQEEIVTISDEREAFFAILFAAISADGEVDDEEIDALALYLTHSSYMSKVDGIALYKKYYGLRNKVGIQPIVSAAIKKVNESRKASLFAVTVDFVLADGIVSPKEESLLEDLQAGLGLDKELASKIIEVLIIKNQA